MDKTLLIAVLVGAALSGAYASCANGCSGHGWCVSHDRCDCYARWGGTDCSKRMCPSGLAFADTTDSGHSYSECSGRGTCDHSVGECQCVEGYTGSACERTSCPNACSGHGTCEAVDSISSSANYGSWDKGKSRACKCDPYYGGADCSKRLCPVGDDPLTTEIECQGVSKGNQEAEVQEITVRAGLNVNGEMTLTYTDAYGQPWTTNPIKVGGDNTFEVLITDTASSQCIASYAFPTSGSREQFAAGGKGNAQCADGTAGEMDAVLSANRAFRNVRVTASSDVTPSNGGAAKYTAIVNDFLLTGVNAGEIGTLSMKLQTGVSAGTVTAQGDHSKDIQMALEGLPYNVIPSVQVSRIVPDIDGSLAVSGSTAGNQFQQKYRVTFSDSSNSGDQSMLQCNAAGCDHDGCAPRYQGVVHSKHFTTQTASMTGDVLRTTDGEDNVPATDSLTGIRAVNQGTFHIRSWQNQGHTGGAPSDMTFTSGTATLTWSYGSGNTDSASWAYDATSSTIQTALRTITGWEGVTVSCTGTAGDSTHDCTVTYAAGYDDGGKTPTMTYHNYIIGGSGTVALTGIAMMGSPAYGQDDWVQCTVGTGHGLAEESVRGHIYIVNSDFLTRPTYEIVKYVDANNFVIKAPDFVSAGTTAFGTMWKATPPMVMWPEFSNSIYQGDTSLQWYATGAGTATNAITFEKTYGDAGTAVTLAATNSAAALTAAINTLLGVTGTSQACTSTDTVTAPRKLTLTCPGWQADNVFIKADAAGGSGFGRRSRMANPRAINHIFAVGDTLTVEDGSTANANRQFKLRSFEWDNTYDATVFAKVWPAPADDYSITDLVAEGNNGTHFSRRVETISTYNREVVNFHLHDQERVGTPGISGWFTFDYDGETSAVVQATATAADIQEKLSSLAGIDIVPTVTTTDVSGVVAWEPLASITAGTPGNGIITEGGGTTFTTGTPAAGVAFVVLSKSATKPCLNEGRFTIKTTVASAAIAVNERVVADANAATNCIVAAEATMVLARRTLSVTFQGQTGDAKKLSLSNNNVLTTGSEDSIFSNSYTNDGSVVYDSSSGTAKPEELAMDFAPGGTINITSQESIMVYLVDDDASGCAGACADTNLLACTSNTDCPAAVFEYNGQYGSPVDLKAAGGGAWCVDATIEGGFQSLSGLSTAAAVCSTTIGTDFSTDFPGASGVAVAKITITLPLGADGSKFHVHQHYTAATKAFLNAGAGNEGLWVKRRRNNNGRTFTLNKVYENRVASVSHMADDNTAGTMTVTYVNTDDSAQGSEPLFSFAAVTNHLWDDDTAPFIQGMKTTRFNDHCGKTGASSTPFVILEDGTTDVTLVCKDTDFATAADLVEHGEKYAYVGLGPDRLYVDPQPDPMTNQAAVITYTGPSGSCSVTEVTRGSTEAKECSGRGNCDYETGTCSCDEGYTLEACSEQTVLV